MDCQRARKRQKEGLADQGTLKKLGGIPLALLPLPGPPGLPFGYPWAPWKSLELAGSRKALLVRACLHFVFVLYQISRRRKFHYFVLAMQGLMTNSKASPHEAISHRLLSMKFVSKDAFLRETP